MEEQKLLQVAEAAAKQLGCTVESLTLDDDNNIEVVIDRPGSPVDLSDCEPVHRAVLAAFDRDIEDYALTVSSLGISGAEADEMLNEINDK